MKNYKANTKKAHYQGGSKQGNHPEHPIRDMFYATLTCLGAIAFALLWWGIATKSQTPLIIGIASSAFASVTVIISFVKAFIKTNS